jgi:hypothetical protein
MQPFWPSHHASLSINIFGIMSVVRKRPAAAGLQQQPPLKRPAGAASQQEPAPCANAPRAPAAEVGLPDWFGEANTEAQQEVYLVTAAKLVNDKDQPESIGEQSPPPLRDPASLSKSEFRAALQDSIANPMYSHKRGGRPATRALELDFYMGVKEGKLEEQHHHAAIKLFEVKRSFLPFKLAMRWRWGIATHWSTSHTQLWSAVQYLHSTTPHKPVVDKRPELWTRDGRKVNLYEESQEPFQASAWNQRRENSISQPFAKKAKKDPFTKLDFSAVVLQHRLLTPNSVPCLP